MPAQVRVLSSPYQKSWNSVVVTCPRGQGGGLEPIFLVPTLGPMNLSLEASSGILRWCTRFDSAHFHGQPRNAGLKKKVWKFSRLSIGQNSDSKLLFIRTATYWTQYCMFVCSDNCTVGRATEYWLATVAYLRFVHVRHEHTVRIRHVRRYQIISTCTFDCS